MRVWARGVIPVAVMAGTLMAGCAPSADDVQADTVYAVGTCLNVGEAPDPRLHPDVERSFQVFEAKDCSAPHTHVVLALAKGEDACPAETDDVIGLTRGTTPYRCLRADPAVP